MKHKRSRIPLCVIAAVMLTALICLGVRAQQSPATDERAGETKTGAITGIVVNDNGQPLAGAAVFVNAVGLSGLARTTTTDSEGNFQVKGLDPALYSVSVRLPAYVAPPRDPDEQQQSTYYRVGDSVKLVQIKGGVITGTVTNSLGEPMVSIGVRAMLLRDANGQPPKYGLAPFGEKTTDDRGIYRIYGLAPGTYQVMAGGSNRFGSFQVNPYDNDSPTYAPSSTRDTAAEIVVRAGDELNNVDIRYRGEPGRTVSGSASGPALPGSYSSVIVTLTPLVNGQSQMPNSTFVTTGSKGFSFAGVIDGDYDVAAQSSLANGDSGFSEPRRIKVKGADITGIELTTKPLSSLAGRITLEPSRAEECKGKRRPLLAETLVSTARNEKDSALVGAIRFFGTVAAPDKEGAFTLRNIPPGRYSFNARFFARYWYLKSITSQPAVPPAAKAAVVNQPSDVAKNWTNVKLGDRVPNVNVTLAAGAASLRGQLSAPEGQKLPAKSFLYLVPAERDQAEDVLRFFVTPVASDGNFAFNNLAPGRYWLLGRLPVENDLETTAKLRLPDEGTKRSKLRGEAEAGKAVIELKPCQNFTDFQLPLKPR